MLTEKQIQNIREELETSKKPLIFFHDDADGVCSFLLFYRFVKEGKGIIIKTTPKINRNFTRVVEEYDPDKIFILDIAIVEQEFLDAVKQKVIWLDHHSPLEREKVMYFNPRLNNSDDNIPVSALCYKIVRQDLWIAMAGAIGDWYWPDFAEEFKKQYPDLLNESINDPETALFETELGRLIGIISFSLKGTTHDAMKCVKILTRIKSPYELLKQETPAGAFVYKKYEKVNAEYQKVLKRALKEKSIREIFMLKYSHIDTSFTKDLANELLHRKPKKIIIIAREKGDEMKVSIRAKNLILPPIVAKALAGINGYGGGHEHACGANIKKEDFDKFIRNFEEYVSKSKSL